MGYQALLFCLDEKLARVVTQVFSELDFTVETVNEPFAAVKKLMAQRYDAIVVDCDNEPNATLLFKSARNSSSNQSSLALALVEGQAGVAKAYRIGANLVLTKPINVEQAKGTLRVARGLLRKNSDAAASGASASSSVPAKVAPAPPAFKAVSPTVQPAAAHSNVYEAPEFESTQPAMAASAEVEDNPVAIPVPEAQTKFDVAGETSASVQQHIPTPAPAKPVAPAIQPNPFKSPVSSPASGFGAASAPAPARETHAPSEMPGLLHPSEHVQAPAPTFGSTSLGSSPSFSTFDKDDSGDSGGNKKILVAAAVVLAVAALGYFGWTKLGKTNTVSQPVSVQQTPVATTAPSPTGAAPVAPSVSTSEVAAVNSPATAATPTTKPAATITNSPDIRIGGETPPLAHKVEQHAIVVKSNPAGKKSQPQSEEAAPQVPNPLAVASPNEKSLSGLVSSVPSALPKVAVPQTLKISQGVSQGLLIKRVQPRYPQNSLAMRIQGVVQMEATINKEGNISNLKVISGDATLARAATDAVRQWRYKPYYLNGDPVEIQTQITVNFKLPN